MRKVMVLFVFNSSGALHPKNSFAILFKHCTKWFNFWITIYTAMPDCTYTPSLQASRSSFDHTLVQLLPKQSSYSSLFFKPPNKREEALLLFFCGFFLSVRESDCTLSTFWHPSMNQSVAIVAHNRRSFQMLITTRVNKARFISSKRRASQSFLS